MDAQEKADLLERLTSGRDAIVAVVAGVSGEASKKAPGEGRWSMLDCMEHVAYVEEVLFSQVVNSRIAEEPLLNPKREERIAKYGADRSRAIDAPDRAKPTGRFATIEDATAHFLASRAKTIQFVENCEEDMRCRTAMHPLFGVVNCQEMLLVIAVHPHRHKGQLEEIKAAVC
jgi:hypothetical protein